MLTEPKLPDPRLEQDLFHKLHSQLILEAVESSGLRCTGRMMQLNSMENRVYSIEIEQEDVTVKPKQVIVKFYRPGRWTANEIMSEHMLQAVLCEENIPTPRFIPVVQKQFQAFSQAELDARISKKTHAHFKMPTSLGKTGEFFFCIWEKVAGKAPLELDPAHLREIGSTVGRMHNLFESALDKSLFERPILSTQYYGEKPLAALHKWGKIPRPLDIPLLNRAEQIVKGLEWVNTCIEFIPTHGDLHRLNLMQTQDNGNFWFVDFDDSMWAPDIQDLWLLASGCDQPPQDHKTSAELALELLLEGYQDFRSMPSGEETLVEPLRTLRMIYYMGWIASRWHDPLFRDTFGFFNEFSYWERALADLEKQYEVLEKEGLLI